MLRFLGLSFVSVRDLFDAVEERSETEVIRLLDEGVNVNGRCEPVSVFLLVYPFFLASTTELHSCMLVLTTTSKSFRY